MNTEPFTKKPMTITATQWDGTPVQGIDIVKWITESGGTARYSSARLEGGQAADPALIIHTLEGDMWVTPGDYVIRGIKGEFYPCKPDIFDASYDRVPGPGEPGDASDMT